MIPPYQKTKICITDEILDTEYCKVAPIAIKCSYKKVENYKSLKNLPEMYELDVSKNLRLIT